MCVGLTGRLYWLAAHLSINFCCVEAVYVTDGGCWDFSQKTCLCCSDAFFFYVNGVILYHLQCCIFYATLVGISGKSWVKSPRCSFMSTLLISTNLVLKIDLRSTISQSKKAQKCLSRCEMSRCLQWKGGRWVISSLLLFQDFIYCRYSATTISIVVSTQRTSGVGKRAS